jgi:hypothetical protein
MARHFLVLICGFLLGCPADDPTGEPPTLSILAPAQGSTHDEGDVAVAVIVEHMLLGDADTAVGWRLPSLVSVAQAHVDDDTPTGFVAISLNGLRIAELEQTTTTLEGLSGGEHVLDAELLNQDGTPLDPPVTDSVSFTVLVVD